MWIRSPGGETEGLSRHPDRLVFGALEPQFDAAAPFVVELVGDPLLRGEVAVGEPVHVVEDVAVEGRVESPGVVVGAVERRLVLLAVRSEEEPGPGTGGAREPGEECGGLLRLEVPEGGARVEDRDPGVVEIEWREGELPREVRGDRNDAQVREVAAHRGGLAGERLLGDVHRRVGGRGFESAQHDARLPGAAGRDFGEYGARSDSVRDFVEVAFEDPDLGGGQVVLGGPGDPFEEVAPHPVVEELGGDGGGISP